MTEGGFLAALGGIIIGFCISIICEMVSMNKKIYHILNKVEDIEEKK